MSVSSLRVCALSLGLILSNSPSQSTDDGTQNRVSVWFVLSDAGSGKFAFEPFAQIVQGKLRGIPDACKEDDPNYRRFSQRYLKVGNSYEVRAGGVPAGRVTLNSAGDASGTYTVNYEGSARIRGRVMALATILPEISGRESNRRAPSESERSAALRLATELYQQAGVPESKLSEIIVENLTHTVLKPDVEPSLIGSFMIEERIAADETRYDALFFVASFTGGELKAELSELRMSLDDKDSQTLSLVDHADIFDSGQDNLVLQLGFYENYRYRIYGRAKDGKHWERLFETETMGCL